MKNNITKRLYSECEKFRIPKERAEKMVEEHVNLHKGFITSFGKSESIMEKNVIHPFIKNLIRLTS